MRLMDVFACTSPLNAGSTVRTSGSEKYVVGGASGPKSRGGFEITVGADNGFPAAFCADARGATNAAPVTAPRVVSRRRLVKSLVMGQTSYREPRPPSPGYGESAVASPRRKPRGLGWFLHARDPWHRPRRRLA